MRERQRLVIDRATGHITTTTEIIDDDADVAQRIRELRASIPAAGPGDVEILAVECNGCGTTTALDPDNPRLPPGWAGAETGDFCPRCQTLS